MGNAIPDFGKYQDKKEDEAWIPKTRPYIYGNRQPTPAERLTLNVFVASVSLVVGFVAGILLVIYG